MELRTSNANERHEEILCRREIRHNVNNFHQKRRLGLRCSCLAAGFFLGRAARGSIAPRKMACRPAAGGYAKSMTAQGHQLALGRCSLVAPPSDRKREWTPRRATSLCPWGTFICAPCFPSGTLAQRWVPKTPPEQNLPLDGHTLGRGSRWQTT